MSSKHFQLLSHLSSPSLIHFYPFILNIYLLIQAHYFLRYNEYSTVALFDIYNLMISNICLHLWYHHYSEDMTCSYHLQMFPNLGSELRTLHMLANSVLLIYITSSLLIPSLRQSFTKLLRLVLNLISFGISGVAGRQRNTQVPALLFLCLYVCVARGLNIGLSSSNCRQLWYASELQNLCGYRQNLIKIEQTRLCEQCFFVQRMSKFIFYLFPIKIPHTKTLRCTTEEFTWISPLSTKVICQKTADIREMLIEAQRN